MNDTATKSQHQIFVEWFRENYTNPNKLANDLGVNSGRVYRLFSPGIEKVPHRMMAKLKALGCPLECEENPHWHGSILRQRIHEQGSTNRELASKIGVKPQYITNLFAKERFSSKFLIKLKEQGIVITYLTPGTGETYTYSHACRNCNERNAFEIPKGTTIRSFIQIHNCRRCGCTLVSKS